MKSLLLENNVDITNTSNYKLLLRELKDLQQLQYGDHPSRVLYVSNLPIDFDENEIRQIFQQYGDISQMYVQTKQCGFIMVAYYDIRSARSAAKYLDSRCYKGNMLHIHFSVPYDRGDQDVCQCQGTLVVFNVSKLSTTEEIKKLFSKFGEVREIQLHGMKLKLECSRPGGARIKLIHTAAKAIKLPKDLPALPPPEELIKLANKFVEGNGVAWNFDKPPKQINNPKRQIKIDFMNQFSQIQEDAQTIDVDLNGKVVDTERNTILIKNISNRCALLTFLKKLENSISMFYKQALLIREGTGQTGVVIVSDLNAISCILNSFNNRYVDDDQEVPCKVIYAQYQGEEMVELLNNILI
ncbi:RNA-binding protein [Entamoeba marina]